MFKKILNSPTLMSWTAQFTRFGTFIFVTPLILKNYNSVEQSFWWLIGSVISFALLADAGFGSAVTRAASYFRAGETVLPRNRKEYDSRAVIEEDKPNVEKLSELLSTTRNIYYFLAGFSVILLLLGTFFFKNVITLSGNRMDFRITYFLLLPLCYLMILNIRWSSFMDGLNFIAYSARFTTLVESLRVTCFIIILFLQLSPLYLVIAMFFATLARYLYIRNFVTQWFIQHNIRINKVRVFNKEIFNSLWPQTWRLAGIFFGNYLIEYGNSFLIAQVKNTNLMAKFLFTTNVLIWITNFSRSPFYANIPTIYKLSAQKKLKELKIKASNHIFVSFSIMISAHLLIGIFGNPILNYLSDHHILVTHTRFIESSIFVIMALTQILVTHSTIHSSIYTSTNHIPFLIPSLATGLAIVGVCYNILPIYGLVGIIYSRFIIEFSFNYWYPFYMSLRLLKWPLFRYLHDIPTYGVKYLYSKYRTFIIDRDL